MSIVLIELGLGFDVGQAVEVGEEVDLLFDWLVAPLDDLLRQFRDLGLPAQVVDERLGMHLLLDEERWGGHDKVRPVLIVLATPDKLRV